MTWAGDSLLLTQIANGFVTLTAASFSECDPRVVRLTDSTLVPVGRGRTTCVVRSGMSLDTLRLHVRERSGRWVVTETESRRAS